MIKSELDQAFNAHFLFEGPVRLEFNFDMPIPSSLSKIKKKQILGKPHPKRPDIDNCIKFYCDVCNGLLYKDDSQVYNIIATKRYSDEPKTVIKVAWEYNNGFKY